MGFRFCKKIDDKKIGVLLLTAIAFTLTCTTLNAQEEEPEKNESFWNNVHFFAEPYYEIKFGQQNEFVFVQSSYQDDLWKLSELNWEQTAQNSFGLKLGTGYKNFKLAVDGKVSVPSVTGTCYDSDWKNYKSTTKEYRSYQTNLSSHTCEENLWLNFGLNLKYDFAITDKIILSPVIEGQYFHTKYTAKGGSLWYGYNIDSDSYYEYNDEENRWTYDYKDSESVMSLERIEYFTWTGINFNWKINNHFTLFAELKINPFTYIESMDSHLLKYAYYYDIMKGFFKGYSAALQGEFWFTPHHMAYLNVNGLYTLIYEGISYSSDDGENFGLTSGYSGSSYKNINIRAGYRFTLQ